MRICAAVPHLHCTGGIRRFLEIGNEFVKRGYEYSILVPKMEPLNWFKFNGKTEIWTRVPDMHFDAIIVGTIALFPRVYRVATRHYVYVIDDDYLNKYFQILNKFFVNKVFLSNRRFSKLFPNAVVVEGGVDTPHKFRPKKVRVGFYDKIYKNNKEIREQLGDLPNVELVPLIGIKNDDLCDYYHSLDYFVTWESKGSWCNTAAEALACGIPVITNGYNCEPFMDRVIKVNSLRDYFENPMHQFSWSKVVDVLEEYMIPKKCRR